MGSAAKVQRNYQITLPVAVRKRAQIRVGDLVDFEVRDDGILIKPLATVERSQLWFWAKHWQAEERKVQQDVRKGRIKVSKRPEDFLDDLDKNYQSRSESASRKSFNSWYLPTSLTPHFVSNVSKALRGFGKPVSIWRTGLPLRKSKTEFAFE